MLGDLKYPKSASTLVFQILTLFNFSGDSTFFINEVSFLINELS